MDEHSVQDRVRLFLSDARAKAGSREELLRRIDPDLRRSYGATAVTAWTEGRGMPPADVLLAIARNLDMSLDEYALGELERRSLQERLRELERQVGQIIALLDEVASLQGLPGMGKATREQKEADGHSGTAE